MQTLLFLGVSLLLYHISYYYVSYHFLHIHHSVDCRLLDSLVTIHHPGRNNAPCFMQGVSAMVDAYLGEFPCPKFSKQSGAAEIRQFNTLCSQKNVK